MTLKLTNISTDNHLNFNGLDLFFCVEILERERERERELTSKHVSNKIFSGRIFCLFLFLCHSDAKVFTPAYFPNKYIDSSVGKRFRVRGSFFCCRLQSARMIRLPMAQLCLAAACSDYMLLLFILLTNN